jgi:hypothetical protein
MGRICTSAFSNVVRREVMLLLKESWASRKRRRGRRPGLDMVVGCGRDPVCGRVSDAGGVKLGKYGQITPSRNIFST